MMQKKTASSVQINHPSNEIKDIATPSEVSTETKSVQKKSHPFRRWLPWFLGVVAVLMALSAFQFFQMQRVANLRREAIIVQEQKMRQFYQSQGLSEEEIQTKLRQDRSDNFARNSSDDPFRSVMRGFRQLTGGGRPHQ